MRRVLILVLAVALGLCAELWVNAIRDPGAELGVGDWETDFYEWHEGDADSAVVSVHDSTRAYEGEYSFLTDTKKDPHPEFIERECFVWCYQMLNVSKAVSDIDSCFWTMFFIDPTPQIRERFFIDFRSRDGNHLRWVMGTSSTINDTIKWVEVPLPESEVWEEYQGDFYDRWTVFAQWSPSDTIVDVKVESWGAEQDLLKFGQEVSWDNIVLRSIAYYDYAAESIDSDPWESVPRSYTPIATFGNKGKLDDFSAYVYSEIYRHDNQEVVFKDSAELSLPSEDSEQVTFATYQHSPSGAGYTLRVFPLLNNDELSTDDTLTLELMASVTEEPDAKRLLTTRRIDAGVLFTFTPEISGQLSIYDASGREVHSHNIESGIREHLWSTADISSGLYFYKLSGRETEVRGKLVILHRLPLPPPSSKGRR